MSETDDTDVLLLIPPNFFLVPSSGSEDSILESSRTVVHKPSSCTAKVLGKLVDQVQTLENRLDTLELSTSLETLSNVDRRKLKSDNDSYTSRNLERKYFTFPRKKRRKQLKHDRKYDRSLTSFDSTSARSKSIPPLIFEDNFVVSDSKPTYSYDSQSMDGDISSIVSTPSKKNDKLLLHEIDEFLTKVESYESPDSKYKAQDAISPENVIKATGDYISKKLQENKEEEIILPSGRVLASSILDKYIYLVKSSASSQEDKSTTSIRNPTEDTLSTHKSNADSTSKLYENRNIVHARSPSIRKLNFMDTKDVQPTSTPKRIGQPNIDSFKPSTNKIYDRATKILEQYKSQSYSSSLRSTVPDAMSSKQEDFKMPQMRPYVSEHKDVIKLTAMQNKFMDSIDTELLSLSDLWGEKEKLDKPDSGKLEEERLKREHCEAIIQQLQRKLLEQQEKLAVALKVDRAKDMAIHKLREAWLKLTSNLDKAEERYRSALDNMMREVDNFKAVADESQKKTHHFETELYKALDLAHDYQEKCKQMQKEKNDIKNALEKDLANQNEVMKGKDDEIRMLKDNYETVTRLNKQSTDCLKNLENSLEKEKYEHDLTKTNTNELSNKILVMGDEMATLSRNVDVLKEKLNEEKSRCNMLERQICDKQNQNSELLRKCDTLECELKTLRKHLETQRNELKSHYQRQLEDAVMSKLNEFQQQLDVAEKEMENDARTRENSLIDTYNKQISRIEDQHKLEIRLLEEKQKEEIKLCRLQLVQASEKIALLESKVSSFRARRGELAAQLHGVMQTQWRRALQILTHPPPPSRPAPVAPSLPLHDTTPDSVCAQDYLTAKLPGQSSEQLRPDLRHQPADNSLSFEGLSDTELQQYIKLLLTKPPNLEQEDCAPHKDTTEEPTSDRPDKNERRDKVKRTINVNKPPWKS